MNRGHSSSSSKLINEKLEEHRISTAKHCPHCGEKIDSKPVCIREVDNFVLPFYLSHSCTPSLA